MQPDFPPSEDPAVEQAEFAVESPDLMVPAPGGTPFYGVAVIEGVPDGSMPRRLFEPGSLSFAPTPFALKWQPAEGPGHDGSVIVGRVDAIWRDGALVRCMGTMDSQGAAGAEAERLMGGQFLRGVSVKIDDMDQTDIEAVYPPMLEIEPEVPEPDEQPIEPESYALAAVIDGSAEFHLPGKHDQREHGNSVGAKQHRARVQWKKDNPGKGFVDASPADRKRLGFTPHQDRQAAVDGALTADGAMMLGPQPDMMIVKSGRIRSLTLLPEPAFVEATVCLGESPHLPPGSMPEEPVIAAAVAPHGGSTSDAAWDGPKAEAALPSPMPVATARAFYAWIDDSAITNGEITKEGGRFGHHDVSGGTPGAANVKACQSGIGVLNGGRGGTTIPDGDVQGVYDHLAKHLRDAGLEPPELTASTAPATVTAAGYTITIPDLWPESWFDEPAELPPVGALHVTPEGRVFGLLAPNFVTHRGFRDMGRRVFAPSGIDYSEFQNKPCLVAGADGDVYRINAGSITFDCGHASPIDPRRADPNWASQHYENSCSIAARVRVGECASGTWVAGGLLHGITADAVERMMACAVSGDWQGGKLKAALLVPVEGYPRAATASVRVREGAIVASAVPVRMVGPRPLRAPANIESLYDLVASAVGCDIGSRYDRTIAELNALGVPVGGRHV